LPAAYWGTTTGTSTNYELDALVPITSYSNVQCFFVDFHIACAASPNININDIGQINLKKKTGQGTKVALEEGDVSGRHIATNDGTDIIILDPRNNPLYLGNNGTVTISGGSITATGSNIAIDTEAAAAADDLDTINGTVTGQIVICSIANASHIPTFKNNTGNLKLQNSLDFVPTALTDRIEFISDGTTLYEISRSGQGTLGRQLILTTTASNSALVAFTNLSSLYSRYEIEFNYILPATDGKGLFAQISTDNGSTYAATNYLASVEYSSNGDAIANIGSTTTALQLSGNYTLDNNWGVKNSASKGVCGRLTIYDPSNTAKNKQIYIDLTYATLLGYSAATRVYAQYTGSTSAINAIKFFFDSGNIASGTFKLYGIK
jgi:hypothetical protein